MKPFAIRTILMSLALLAGTLFSNAEDLLQKYGGQDAKYDFDVPALTKAPKGYKPAFIEHYGRHGSRYAYSAHYYTDLMEAFKVAKEKDCLTERGKALMRSYMPHFADYMLHMGELTEEGWRQQEGIARTMVKDFPDAFKGEGAYAYASSSSSGRSMMSMAGFCTGLQGAAPKLDVKAFQGKFTLKATMPRDRNNPFFVPREESEWPLAETRDEFADRRVDCKAILGRIFTDVDAVVPQDKQAAFTRTFYVLAIGMNSLREDERTDFSGIFTEDDLKALSEAQNYRAGEEWWVYESRCASVVLDMVEDAEKRLDSGKGGVTARFGHDHVVMPVLRLMGVGRYSGEPTTADEFINIFNVVDAPMACNLQIVFYTSRKADKPVLVKFLLNGKEEKLCIPAEDGPYYEWNKVKELFRSRIARFPVVDPSAPVRVGGEPVDWDWKELGGGAQVAYAQLNLFNSVQSISVIRYPMAKFTTFVANDSASAADSTSALAQRHGAFGAINASYFNVKTLYPSTWTKDDGKVEGWTYPSELFRVDGLVAIKNGHDVRIFTADTLGYEAAAKGYKEAIAAGPVLLRDGVEARPEWPGDGFYTKRHPRTFIGTTAGGMVYLVVIDGRFPGQGIGATIHETVEIAKLLGLRDALNLDGGGSSTLWTKEHGVVNHPYDNKKFDHCGQRVVPNIIGVK